MHGATSATPNLTTAKETAVFWTILIALLFAFIATASAPLPGPGYKPRIVTWFWSAFAWTVSRPRVADWLIRRAMRTPYTHLPGYMNRYWLLNAYEKANGKEVTSIRWLPSVRVHHILRRDNDRHKHDHPWDARTIILKNYYFEDRIVEHGRDANGGYYERTSRSARFPGDTAPILFGDYHSVAEVPEGGVWTLFITFGYQGTWGFLVDGVKVPWREYMEMHPEKPWASDDAS